MKKSPHFFNHALAATCLTYLATTFTASTGAIAQTAAPSGLAVPAKSIPVPSTVSPQLEKIIGAPLRTNWDIQPKTGEEWKPVAEAGALPTIKNVPGMLERLKVKIEPTMIDGVRAYIVTPETIAPENRNRQLIHMHGGCYVLNPREAGLPRGDLHGGFRAHQGDLGRLSHAAGSRLPRSPRRRHHGLESRTQDDDPPKTWRSSAPRPAAR